MDDGRWDWCAVLANSSANRVVCCTFYASLWNSFRFMWLCPGTTKSADWNTPFVWCNEAYCVIAERCGNCLAGSQPLDGMQTIIKRFNTHTLCGCPIDTRFVESSKKKPSSIRSHNREVENHRNNNHKSLCIQRASSAAESQFSSHPYLFLLFCTRHGIRHLSMTNGITAHVYEIVNQQ